MRNLSVLVAVGAATLALTSPSPARAGTTKAWTVAKANLPAQTAVAIGIDAATIIKSATFQQVFQAAIAKSTDAQQVLDQVKATCKIDPLAVVKSVAVGLDAQQDDGAVYVTVAGFTPGKLVGCLKDVVKAQQQAQGSASKVDAIKVTTDGNITEMSGGDKTIYFGWLGGDTLVVVPKHMDDKTELKTWMGGGFSQSEVAKTLASVKTDATVFVTSSVGKSLDATHTIHNGYGWANFAGGKIAVEFHGNLGDPAAAASLASDANTQLAGMRTSPPIPALGPMFKTLAVTSVKSELVATTSMSEADLSSLISLALSM